MMKHLYENLEILCESRPFTKVAYFFHELGEEQERTFSGLLATLLKQLVESHNELAFQPLKIFRKLKETRKKQSQASLWNEYYLEKALKSMEGSNAMGVVVLFIDGLDECLGDRRKQLEFLVPWVLATRGLDFQLRMCLASRPLQEIQFRLSAFPECRLHEWTAEDISEYIRDKLSRTWNELGPEYRDLYWSIDSTCLIRKITRKAQGVFLWVKVVVNNLIIGMEEGSTNQELIKTLDSLPDELEDLYCSIIGGIPKGYFHEAKRCLRLMFTAHSLGLLEFLLAIRDPEEVFAKRAHSTHEYHRKVRNECFLMETRIRSRCRGLLQVTRTRNYGKDLRIYNETQLADEANILAPVLGKRVEFLHLSICEYLESTGIVNSSGSSEKQALMAASVGLLRLIPPVQLFRSWEIDLYDGSDTTSDLKTDSNVDKLIQSDNEDFCSQSFPDWSPIGEYTRQSQYGNLMMVGYQPIKEFFRFAWLLEKKPNPYRRQLLVELDRTCTLADRTWYQKYLTSVAWDQAFTDTVLFRDLKYSADVTNLRSWNVDLFCVCLSHGLDTYVHKEIQRARYKPELRTGRPLLRFLFDQCTVGYGIPSPKTLQLLLDHGARPNEKYAEDTSLAYAIKSVDQLFNLCVSFETDDWASLLLLMVEHGSTPHQPLPSQILKDIMGMLDDYQSSVEITNDTLKLFHTLIERGARPNSSQLSCLPENVKINIEKMIARLEGP